MGQSQFAKMKKDCLQLMRNERYNESLQILDNLENNNLKNRSEISEFVNFQRGLCYMGLKQYNEAIKYFQKCNSKQSKINVGLANIKLKNLDQAKTYFENLNKEYQNNPYILQLYGYCLLVGFKDHQNAALVFEQSVSLDNKLFISYHNLALCYKMQKKFEKAYHFCNKWKLPKQQNLEAYSIAATALLTDNQQIDYLQRSEIFDCLYYSYHLIRVKEFLQKRPSKIYREIQQDQLIQQNINSGVTVSKITINQISYLKKEFKFYHKGNLFSFIPQSLINELVISSFCIGNYLNYNLCYDYNQDQNQYSYVVIYTNYYEDGSLSKYLQNNTLTKFQKQLIVFKIIQALQQLHSKKVNHLDLKLQNIVIRKSQTKLSVDPIIIDFGASIVNLNPLSLIYQSKDEITAFQQIQFLTPSYKIPEQKVDSRSDIFNLGKIILEVYSNQGLKLLQDFQIDTSHIKKDDMSNQLYKYIQEEIRNKEIYERPIMQLILYQFSKDYLFDLIYSCLLDQSLIDYQVFMASMYNHFEKFWIEMLQEKASQQQIKSQDQNNYILQNKEFFCAFKLFELFDNELLVGILFDNRLLYYFSHGILQYLQFEKDDIEGLIEKVQIDKRSTQNKDQILKYQIELERKIFSHLISQVNKKQQHVHENQINSSIQELEGEEEEEKEGMQTEGYQKINQYYMEATSQIKEQITDDYIQNQCLQNLKTITQQFQKIKNFQSQDITQIYLQENTNDYFKQ